MNKIIEFLDKYYIESLNLSSDFSITRQKEWNTLILLNELSIQLGHVYNIIYKSSVVNEQNRNFDNLADELSDIILGLIALSANLNIDIYNIQNLKQNKEDNWYSLIVIFGQLNEAIMELEGYRFNKPRVGFNTTLEFIENRILIMLDITFQISKKYNLDMIEEYELMLKDANNFLKKYKGVGKK